MSKKNTNTRILKLIKNQDISPLGCIFAQASVLAKIRMEYSQFIDESFPNALDFLPFARETTITMAVQPGQMQINEQTLTAMKAADFINIAYPVTQYDENGKPIANRQQRVINTVKAFVDQNIDEYHFANPEARTRFLQLQQATSVFAALNSIDEMLMKMRKMLNDPDISEDNVATMIPAYMAYCEQLQKSFTEQSAAKHILTRGERAESWHGRLHNWLEDTIKILRELFHKISNLLHVNQHNPKDKQERSSQQDKHTEVSPAEIARRQVVSKTLAEAARKKSTTLSWQRQHKDHVHKPQQDHPEDPKTKPNSAT
jgi:hypothetical protein